MKKSKIEQQEEWIGDSLLEMFTRKLLVNDFPNCNISILHLVCEILVSNKNLSYYIQHSSDESKNPKELERKVYNLYKVNPSKAEQLVDRIYCTSNIPFYLLRHANDVCQDNDWGKIASISQAFKYLLNIDRSLDKLIKVCSKYGINYQDLIYMQQQEEVKNFVENEKV